MPQYNFNSHKLIYHLDRVNEYFKTGDCYPLSMEISPIGRCNHRCLFCAYDYIKYPNRKLETQRLLDFINEVSECKVKSLLFAGEGEPLLHPDIDKFIIKSKENNIDVGLFTNGQMLKEELAEKILPGLSFIRFSFNGGTEEDYSKIHRVSPKVFNNVIQNIRNAVTIRKKFCLSVDIGAQYVLLPENIESLINATKLLKNLGIDYFVIKPFIQRSAQSYILQQSFNQNDISKLFEELNSLSDDTFHLIIRKEFYDEKHIRDYNRCYGTSFITVLNSAGDISTCLSYWDKKEFSFGNIYENSFFEIWNGEKRKKIIEYLKNNISVHDCPSLCRQNNINKFLWDIKNPSLKHINFI